MYTIGMVGAGNMAMALVKGYHLHKDQDVQIRCFDLDPEKCRMLQSFDVYPTESIGELVQQSDYLFLCVKPQQMFSVCQEIKPFLQSTTVVVSIAAGIQANHFQAMLGDEIPLILAMPNTPLLLGKGATALACVSPTSEQQLSFVSHVFGCCGTVSVVHPCQMNAIIPLNGSAPAFIYEITKHFLSYATQQEIHVDKKQALNLFAQTLIGAAHMMLQSNQDIEELIEMVSSKGGTTIAGLETLRKHDLKTVIHNACEDCKKRADQFSEGVEQQIAQQKNQYS